MTLTAYLSKKNYREIEMIKYLYLLIGLKGSGKSYIGELLGRTTNIYFLRIEDIWLSLRHGENGWNKVEAAIDNQFSEHDKVVIETLALGEGFRTFHDSVKKKYKLIYIHVLSDFDECLARVKSRDKSIHIPVSDDNIIEYNKAALQVVMNWDLEINNNEFGKDEDILESIIGIVK